MSPPPFLLLCQTAPAARRLPVMNGVGARPVPSAISLQGAAGGDRRRIFFQDAVLVALARRLVAMLDQQPVGLLAAAALCRSHFMRTSTQLPCRRSPSRTNFRSPRFSPSCGSPIGHPVAAVPELHRAAAILALGNGALEVAVVERMILGLHRQPLDLGIERRPLGHRPRQEDAVELEPEIVVQARGIVPLDDEAQFLGGGHGRLARRLVGLAEVALGAIGGETVFAQRMQPIAFGRARYGLGAQWETTPAARRCAGDKHLGWATDPTSWPLVQV